MGSAPKLKDEDNPEFADELKPGTELLHGQYTIESFLNSGGFGITYLARDSLDRKVVIKECFPGSFCRRTDTRVGARSRAHQAEFKSIVKLFVQEAWSLSKLRHPNIVGVHQVFEDNDTAYMALDFVEGFDLLETLEDGGKRLEPDQIRTILEKILDAVGFIHSQGILHRDISPDNILLDQATNNPVLIDFGAAREEVSKASRVLSAMRVVKDGYSPQEFYIQGSEQTPSSDLYALAATFYHLISGETPPNSQSRLAAIAAGEKDEFVPLASVSKGHDEAFTSAIDKAMSVFPKDRLQSAGEWLAAIDLKAHIAAADKAVAPIAAESETEDAAAVAPVAPAPANEVSAPSKMPILLGTAAALAIAAVIGVTQSGILSEDDAITDDGSTTTEFGSNNSGSAQVEGPTVSVEPAPETPFVEDVVVAQPVVTDAPATDEAAVADAPVEDAIVDDTAVAAADDPMVEPTTEADDAPVVAETDPDAPIADDVAALDPATNLQFPEVVDPNAPVDLVAPDFGAQAGSIVPSDFSEVIGENATLPVGIDAPVDETVAAFEPADPAPTPEPQIQITGSIAPRAEGTTDLAIATPTDQSAPQGEVAVLAAVGDAESVASADVQPPEPPAPVEEAATPTEAVVDPVTNITTDWSIALPFFNETDRETTIAEVTDGAADWMAPGQRIVEVNGQAITSIREITPILRSTIDPAAVNSIEVTLGVEAYPGADIIRKVVSLPVVQEIGLPNGLQFQTRSTQEGKKTIVTAVPRGDIGELQLGDVVVGYMPTAEKVDVDIPLQDILSREITNDVEQFTFAVSRDDAMWIASFGYSVDQ